jgi:hypothetical protein
MVITSLLFSVTGYLGDINLLPIFSKVTGNQVLPSKSASEQSERPVK